MVQHSPGDIDLSMIQARAATCHGLVVFWRWFHAPIWMESTQKKTPWKPLGWTSLPLTPFLTCFHSIQPIPLIGKHIDCKPWAMFQHVGLVVLVAWLVAWLCWWHGLGNGLQLKGLMSLNKTKGILRIPRYACYDH